MYIFSKIGRFAKEEVVISLIYAKCLPVLLYGTEACHILAWDKRSVEFTVTCSLMKLLRTSSAIIVEDCQKFFTSYQLAIWQIYEWPNFWKISVTDENYVCRLFAGNAQCSPDTIYLLYGDDIISSCNLRDFVFNDILECRGRTNLPIWLVLDPPVHVRIIVISIFTNSEYDLGGEGILAINTLNVYYV